MKRSCRYYGKPGGTSVASVMVLLLGMLPGTAEAQQRLTFTADVGNACSVTSDDSSGLMVPSADLTTLSSALGGGNAAGVIVRSTAAGSAVTFAVPDEFTTNPATYAGNETIAVQAVSADGFQEADFDKTPAVGQTEYTIHARATDDEGFVGGAYELVVQVTCAARASS